jgi:hypothetical protein
MDSLSERFWLKVNKTNLDGCWLWTGAISPNGYGTIGAGGKYGRTLYAHVVAHELQVGPVPKGKMVLHGVCNNKLCMRHIYLGDHERNMKDRDERGRTAKGANHGWRKNPHLIPRGSRRGGVKLTEEMIPSIRSDYNDMQSYSAVSRKYGVTAATIRYVILGKTWSHV